eukprot:COSAG04_NODE_19391_length_417_cov_0.984277_2_plen_33_part_01
MDTGHTLSPQQNGWACRLMRRGRVVWGGGAAEG